MPQNPIGVSINAETYANVSTTLNITAATVIKASIGVINRVSVIVAGSTAGSVNDTTTTGAAATANEVFSIPNTTGVYPVNFPCKKGIVVVPGTGQTIAVAFD